MSYSYQLLCVDCREVLFLGNIIPRHDGSGWAFAGVLDNAGEWLGNIEVLRLMEKFLIVHRGHEVRVIPERFLLRELDPEGRYLTYIEDPREVLERAVVPEPDQIEDAARVPPGVVERIHRTAAKQLGDS